MKRNKILVRERVCVTVLYKSVAGDDAFLREIHDVPWQ